MIAVPGVFLLLRRCFSISLTTKSGIFNIDFPHYNSSTELFERDASLTEIKVELDLEEE